MKWQRKIFRLSRKDLCFLSARGAKISRTSASDGFSRRFASTVRSKSSMAVFISAKWIFRSTVMGRAWLLEVTPCETMEERFCSCSGVSVEASRILSHKTNSHCLWEKFRENETNFSQWELSWRIPFLLRNKITWNFLFNFLKILTFFSNLQRHGLNNLMRIKNEIFFFKENYVDWIVKGLRRSSTWKRRWTWQNFSRTRE